jgi:DnaJ like chaperone protein
MSIWRRVADAVEAAGGGIATLAGWLGGLVPGIGDPHLRRQVTFSVALIALSAKMAKADGVVTSDEVSAFRTLFAVPASEARAVNRLFDVAKQDVAGYRTYATRIADFYRDNRAGLEDVMDGLFFIAKADGAVHQAELGYLESVAAIFGFADRDFERIAFRHVVPPEGDPYVILGADRSWPMTRIRARYRELVAENHPDRVTARGLPQDFIAIATDRMAAINAAYERIERDRRAVGPGSGRSEVGSI